mgnify:CR=1 FL=1
MVSKNPTKKPQQPSYNEDDRPLNNKNSNKAPMNDEDRPLDIKGGNKGMTEYAEEDENGQREGG